MREDSTEYEEGIIIDEYRKGFKLGERLLRPSMVKVSAGPGPVKAETVEPSNGESEDAGEVSEESSAWTGPAWEEQNHVHVLLQAAPSLLRFGYWESNISFVGTIYKGIEHCSRSILYFLRVVVFVKEE